jgi:hypothetical protein
MRRLFYIGTGVFLLCMLLVSCDSDSDPNSGIIPTSDSLQLRYTDTTTLITFIEYDSLIRTDATERVLLGNYWDPVFGKTSSSFYSTFTIAQSFTSNNSMIVDSVILTMRADGGYGDLSKFTGYQVLQVFEVTEPIPDAPTIGYNSSTSFNYNPVPIATYGYAPQFFPFGNDPAAIRIKLNPTFANRFFQEDTINSLNVREYIRGIYVRIDPAVANVQAPGQGGIAYFKLNSDVSNLKVYYRIGSTPQSPLKFPMGTTSNTRVNIFKHGYSLAEGADPALLTKLSDSTNTTANDKLYIQSIQGIRIKVKMPYLQHYQDSGKIIVNRAEFVIPVDPTQDFHLYDEPDGIMAYTIGSDKKIRVMDDIYYTYYDGAYNPTTLEYKIVLTQYIQQVLNNESIAHEFYFDIPIFSKYTDAFRLILNSTEHATNPMRLNLTYTRIPSL